MAERNSTETVLNYTKKGIVALADDIVQQLHDWQHIVDESKGDAVVVMLSGRVFGDAAAEIERLRAEVARLGAFLHPIGEEARRGRLWSARTVSF